MHSKVVAAFVTLSMLMVASVIIVDDSDEFDASESNENVNIYYTTDLQAYVLEPAVGYNLSNALSSETALLETMKSSVDNEYKKNYTNEYGPYTSINVEWGKITRTSDVVSGYVWNVFVYTFDGTNNAGQWKIADKTLGFYRPFSDYNASYATANIALYYGPQQSAVPASLSQLSTKPLTSITQNENFQFQFVLNYTDANDDEINRTLTGYGSDAAMALINAVGSSNVSLYLVPGVSYGYLNSLYNLATTDNGDGTWSWWSMENNRLTPPEGMTVDDDEESQFYLGFYTPFIGSELDCNRITLTYA